MLKISYYTNMNTYKVAIAIEVAQWFIKRAQQDYKKNIGDLLTQIKLQKLLYFAQGVHMVWNDGQRLFSEKIYHESNGPVVRSVASFLKPFGNNSIEDIKDKNGESIIFNWSKDETEEIEHTLKSVYKSFGQFSAFKLVEMTQKDPCWLETKKGEEIKPEEIQKTVLKRYFK